MVRFQRLEAGLQGAAWYYDGATADCGGMRANPTTRPPPSTTRGSVRPVSAGEAARTCGKCGTMTPPLDLAAFG